MSAPDSNIVEVAPGAGFTASNPGNIPVFCGVALGGPMAEASNCNAQPFSPRSQASIASMYLAGPLARKAAYMSAKGVQCLCIRLPATARAASVSALANTLGGSSTITPTVTGTPLDGFDTQIKWIAGGNVGTAGASYQYSLDGGQTWSVTIALGTSLTITTGAAFTTATGLTVALGGSGKVISVNDLITFWCRAASAAILPQTVTANVASTAVYALSGSPTDAYGVQIQWLTGTTSIGTVTGASYRYSLDGGQTWSVTYNLALGTSFTLADDVYGNGTGLTVTLTSAQIITAGDLVVFGTTAPEFAFSDLQTALTNLRAAGIFVWSFIGALGPMTATDGGSLDSLLTGWATGTRRTWAIVETRARSSWETVAAYRTRILTEWIGGGFASTRVFPAVMGSYTTDPITARVQRKTCALHYLARLATYSISTDPGQVSLGNLSADVNLGDPVTGAPVEYDARTDSSLFDAGFLTLRTFEGWPGVYPTGGVLIPPAGQINLIAYRRVLDAVENAIQIQMRLEMLAKFRMWPSMPAPKAPYNAGDVYEADARAIEARLNYAGRSAVVATGDASAVTVTLQRTPLPIAGGKKKLVCKVKVTALDYIYGFEADVGIVDPALDALLT